MQGISPEFLAGNWKMMRGEIWRMNDRGSEPCREIMEKTGAFMSGGALRTASSACAHRAAAVTRPRSSFMPQFREDENDSAE